MSIGATARRLLGPAFPVVGAAYRRVFVDIRKVAGCIPSMPDDALLLDIGVGDGAILNPILDLQPTLRVIGIDLAPDIGLWVHPEHRSRVELHPSTTVRDYIAAGGESPHAVLLSDVFHHVPSAERPALVRDIRDLFENRSPVIIVKDIIPHGLRSRLAFWADRNISGDHLVEAAGPVEVSALLRSTIPGLRVESSRLAEKDYPNYCIVYRGMAALQHG